MPRDRLSTHAQKDVRQQDSGWQQIPADAPSASMIATSLDAFV